MKKAVFLKNKKNKKNIQIVNNHQHNLQAEVHKQDMLYVLFANQLNYSQKEEESTPI